MHGDLCIMRSHRKGVLRICPLAGEIWVKGMLGRRLVDPLISSLNVYHHADVGLLCLDHPVREKTN